ncbi:DUF5522 domain-containing protein [Mucilaginibacter sp. R-33]
MIIISTKTAISFLHLKRGYCCKNKCLHCPWSYGKVKLFGNDTESSDSDK